METLKRTAEENCCLGSEISLDELPAGGGIYAEPGELSLIHISSVRREKAASLRDRTGEVCLK